MCNKYLKIIEKNNKMTQAELDLERQIDKYFEEIDIFEDEGDK